MRVSIAVCAFLSVLTSTNGWASQQFNSRRQFLASSVTTSAVVALVAPPANAIPMVTTSEFTTILRDSGRSIARVEFSGAKSETVTVFLQDGTTFGLKDVVESSVDPRSPLKIQALCREYGVPVKFTDLEAILAGKGRNKVYTNARVQEAQAKEREKQARIEQDERDRIAAVKKMEEEERAAKDDLIKEKARLEREEKERLETLKRKQEEEKAAREASEGEKARLEQEEKEKMAN